MYKKNTESVPPFQVEYGLSLILTRCVVSNGSKTLALKWHVVNRVLELCCFEWFQNFCYHNFRLTSLRTHLIIKESSIKI